MSFFDRLVQSFQKRLRKSTAKDARRRALRLGLESFEDRRVLAAVVSSPDSTLDSEYQSAASSSSSETQTTLGLPASFDLSGDASTQYPSVIFQFSEPKDISAGDGIAYDIFNPSGVVARLVISVRTPTGQIYSAARNILPYSHVKIGAPFNQNLRVWGLPFEDPNVHWTDGNLGLKNPSTISRIDFFLDRPKAPTTVTISNVRLINHISIDSPLIDIFGQYAGKDWEGKAHSAEELAQMIQQDIDAPKAWPPIEGRDEFGGLLNSGVDFGGAVPAGGTGSFTTAKDTTGRWWLVTPVGNPYFAVSVDAVRSSSTTSVLGREHLFDPSVPLNEEGEADFYAHNIERYNEVAGPDASWQKRTLERLADWGFTSVGNWSDEEMTAPVEGAKRLPYLRTALRKRVMPLPQAEGANKPTTTNFPETNFAVPAFYTANGRWPFPDVYSQQFLDYMTKDTVPVQTGTNPDGTPIFEEIPAYFGVPEVARTASDPYAIGYFVDNEIRWDGSELATRVAIPRQAINLLGSNVRAAFLQHLSTKYSSVGSLMNAWGVTVSPALSSPNTTPLTELGSSKIVFPLDFNTTAQADLNELLGLYADQYYRVVREGFKAHMPNKLYLGSRLYGGTAPAPVMDAVAKYADVISINMYRTPADLAKTSWAGFAAIDKPLLIAEFGYISTDQGHFGDKHPNVDSATQAERGIKYQQYMDLMAANPLIVGTSVFDYVDFLPTGRDQNLENYNWGLVNILDLPNTDYVNRVSDWNRFVYDRRLGIKPVNTAPVLANVASPGIDIAENDRNSPGTPVWMLLGGASDADSKAESGIAITHLSNAENGNWQYTIDGGITWFDFRTVSLSTARLLPSNGNFSRIRFQPNQDFYGTLEIGFYAWDQSQGYSGTQFNLSGAGKVGGTTAFSSEYRTSTIDVVKENHAPLLDPSVKPPLLPIKEDQTNSYGTPIWVLAQGTTDQDPNSLRGVAISGLTGVGNGVWQYTLDNGNTWQTVGAIGMSSALLLPANGNWSRIRFVPYKDFAGDLQLEYVAWDQSRGTAGGRFDLTSPAATGNSAAFSAASRISRLTIAAVNDAPKLQVEVTPQLVSINEDHRASYGTPVWYFRNGVSDVDAGASAGIAITRADTSYGVWQYTLDSGATWQAFGNVSLTAALLLPANGNVSRIRFVPNANFSGNVEIGYYAWDQTQGTSGRVFDLSGSGKLGGETAFSVNNRVGRLTVVPINDAPRLNPAISPSFPPLNEDNRNSYGTPVWQLLSGISDVDALAKRGIAITSADTTNGAWQFTIDGGVTWNALGAPSRAAAVLLPADGNLSRLRFVPNANFNGNVEIGYFAWDQTQGTAGGTYDLTAPGRTGNATAFSVHSRTSRLAVLPVNDVPQLGLSGSTGYQLNRPAILLAEGATVTDVDSPNFANGYLVLSITSGIDPSNRLAIGGAFTLSQQGDAMNVMLGGTSIGTLTSDGTGTRNLQIDFNANATPVIAEQLLRSITFRTVDSTSTTPTSRIVKVSLHDGQGASMVRSRTINVTA